MTTTKPVEIRAARRRVRAAGAELAQRRAADVADALVEVLANWCDPDSSWTARLSAALSEAAGFSEQNVRAGLAAGLGAWRPEALREIAERELGAFGNRTRAIGFESTSVALAGSIPMPTILSLLTPLLLRSGVVAKTAARDPVTASLVRESVEAVDPALAAALEIVSFPHDDAACMEAFADAPCVVATGSDEAVASITRAAPPGARTVAYGHRLSVAVLGPMALDAACAAAVARDVALWDQLGCLSPIAVYVVGAVDADVDAFTASLVDALRKEEAERPRGVIGASEAALLRHEHDTAQFRGARVASGEALSFVVVRERDAEPRPAPLHRFVRVCPVYDGDELWAAIEPISRHLAGAAVAGFGIQDEEVAHGLARRGASRICAPGRLQAPPLEWHHDNQPLLLPIARLADLENTGQDRST